MRLYLLEAYSSDLKFSKNSTIVALTPKVCYLLDKVGIKYSIIEDFYDEVDLLSKEKEVYASQMKWINQLDKFLQNNIKELKSTRLKLGAIYLWYFRMYVFDALFIRCFTMKAMINKLRPSSITFVSYKPKELKINYNLEYCGKSNYAQIIPLISDKKRISLKQVFLKSRGIGEEKVEFNENFQARLNSLLRQVYKKFRFGKTLYFLYNKYKLRTFVPKAKKKLNIFVITSAYNGIEFIVKALNRGHNIYQLFDKEIIRYTYLGEKKHLDTEKIKIPGLNDDAWKSTAKFLERSNLITWFNKIYQLDISDILLLRLKHFILNVCPKLLTYFNIFTEFYRKEKIDFVLTPTISTLQEYAALAAANYCDHIKTVGVQHGVDVFPNRLAYEHEMAHFDIYVCTDKEMKQHFMKICKKYKYLTKVYLGSYKLLNAKEIGALRAKKALLNKEKQIIFLPALFTWDRRRLGSTEYPDTWYYLFQKSLIEYFSKKKGYIFTWKGLPVSDAIYNPLPDFVKDNKFYNIKIATNPFIEHLCSANKVICDYPCTGFYESVIAGVPTLSLYHRVFKIRKSALKTFGNLLKKYDTSLEAVRHIDEFLERNPEEYKTSVATEDADIVAILEENSKR